jgi:3-(methylsulfanyl)propanoyl-CoA dehydrogenase
LATTERAYQDALRYAQERKQGRAIGAPKGESSPIVEHPDVRRALLTMKAYTEAMRALLYTNAVSIDLARHHQDPAEREARRELVELLTPISKAWCTDLGVDLASIGLQVHGGMGYVEETGVAQYLRDSRISPIYEGTNGIQAIDLVMRKVPMRGGGVMGDLLTQMEALGPELDAAGPELAGIQPALAAGINVLREATGWILSSGQADPNDALAGAAPYLRLAGLVVGGWLMARSALAASRLLPGAKGSDAVFLREKIGTARFYAGQLLPQAAGLLPAITAGAGPLFQVDLSHATLG